jgi:pimeloyl-ACP methyl ester carboxylesterase
METTADWWRAYFEQPQTAKLPDGRSMTFLCRGSGSPTVIFEAGLGGIAASWRMVQPALSKTTRTCSYDRAGLGTSDPAKTPRDVNAITDDLEALLKAARIRGPYVLVGHSMGSYGVQMFAYRHPDQVAGVVLVDPSSDNQTALFNAAAPGLQKAQDDELESSKRCIAALASGPLQPGTDLYRACIPNPPADIPADLTPRMLAYSQSVTHLQAQAAENDSFIGDTAQLVAARRRLPDLPLIVLTAENTTNFPGVSPAEQQAAARIWFDLHEALARLSDKGQHRLVKGSGHAIQREQPAVVIAAVEEVIAAARKR